MGIKVCSIPTCDMYIIMFSHYVETLVVVRDSQHHVISQALEGLQTRHGVHLNFILCDIPDQEDWGTADSLRHIRLKIKVLLIFNTVKQDLWFHQCRVMLC